MKRRGRRQLLTSFTEVIGMEGDEMPDGEIIGEFRSMGLRPYTLDKAKQYGFDQPYLEACL